MMLHVKLLLDVQRRCQGGTYRRIWRHVRSGLIGGGGKEDSKQFRDAQDKNM